MSSASVPTQVRAYQAQKTGGKFVGFILTMILLAIVAIGVTQFVVYPRWTAPKLTTPYQAVLMSNGAVYFGKLDKVWTPYPVLTDVFYLQSITNNETKQTSNVLVKRGKEWHSPDHMVLNGRDILLIEPVGPDSKVAQLITQSRSQ
jgi:hypothetical protein